MYFFQCQVFGIALALLFAVSAAFAVCFYKKKNEMMMGDPRNMADLPDDIPTWSKRQHWI